MGDMHVELTLPLDTIEDDAVRTVRLVFPFLPPSKNEYDNLPFMWKRSAKQRWAGTPPRIKPHKPGCIARACEAEQVPRGLVKVGLAAHLIFPTNRVRDPQNYAQTLWHFVPDGLVWSGFLVNDNAGRIAIPENWGVTFGLDDRRNVDPDKRKFTVITLSYRRPAQRVDTPCG